MTISAYDSVPVNRESARDCQSPCLQYLLVSWTVHSLFTPVMSIVATLQPLVGAAHTVNVTVNMQLGDIRKEAAELMEWHNDTWFSGPCSVSMAVGELPCPNMYSTLRDCGVTGDTLVTLIRIPVPPSITDAEKLMPDTMRTIAAAHEDLELWMSPDGPIAPASDTTNAMNPSAMYKELHLADIMMQKKTHPLARGVAMANRHLKRILNSDLVGIDQFGKVGAQTMSSLKMELRKAERYTIDIVMLLCRGMSGDQNSREEFMIHATESYGMVIDKELEEDLMHSYGRDPRSGGLNRHKRYKLKGYDTVPTQLLNPMWPVWSEFEHGNRGRKCRACRRAREDNGQTERSSPACD